MRHKVDMNEVKEEDEVQNENTRNYFVEKKNRLGRRENAIIYAVNRR
jgi:hypothetical protein